MTYKVGDDYRYIAEFKNGSPRYATAKVRSITQPNGEAPGKLWLENDHCVELVAVLERKRP